MSALAPWHDLAERLRFKSVERDTDRTDTGVCLKVAPPLLGVLADLKPAK